MERLAALQEQAAVRDLVGQGVLERVLALGEQADRIEQLGGLEARERCVQRVVRQLGDGLQQRERHVLADHGSRLEQTLVVGLETVDASGQDRLDRRRHPEVRQILGQTVGTAPTDQRAGLDQAPDALLQEERVALGLLDQVALQRDERLVSPPAATASRSSAPSAASGSIRTWVYDRLLPQPWAYSGR